MMKSLVQSLVRGGETDSPDLRRRLGPGWSGDFLNSQIGNERNGPTGHMDFPPCLTPHYCKLLPRSQLKKRRSGRSRTKERV